MFHVNSTNRNQLSITCCRNIALIKGHSGCPNANSMQWKQYFTQCVCLVKIKKQSPWRFNLINVVLTSMPFNWIAACSSIFRINFLLILIMLSGYNSFHHVTMLTISLLLSFHDFSPCYFPACCYYELTLPDYCFSLVAAIYPLYMSTENLALYQGNIP